MLLNVILMIASAYSASASDAPEIRHRARFGLAQVAFERAEHDFNHGSRFEDLALFSEAGDDIWECTDVTQVLERGEARYAVGKVVMLTNARRERGVLNAWLSSHASIRSDSVDTFHVDGVSRADTFVLNGNHGLSSHRYYHDFEIPMGASLSGGPAYGIGYKPSRASRTLIMRKTEKFAQFIIRVHYYGSEQRAGEGASYIEYLRCQPLFDDGLITLDPQPQVPDVEPSPGIKPTIKCPKGVIVKGCH